VTAGIVTAPKDLDRMNKMNRMLAANRLAILSILCILSKKLSISPNDEDQAQPRKRAWPVMIMSELS
jgi:hypothetical protein